MEWISVEERLPDPDVMPEAEVIAFSPTGGGVYGGAEYRGVYGGFTTHDGMRIQAVTHWMPLPDPPAKVGA